jgi:aspartyl-tRNA(Asn)/glutamyl-tRNA(Gln) amidotransferase subunit A
MTDWIELPLAEIAGALRDGRLTARDLTEAAIARHEHFGGPLNAYKTWDAVAARRQADDADAAFARGEDRGPLHGLPISIKDLYGVRGYPIYAGSPKRLPAQWERQGPVVAALTAQRSIVMGKTHTVEFAYGGLGTNPHWGAPVNPWDAKDHRVPGGSSAGAGVSLAEGSALVALGSDTGGSVRVPASLTGAVGLKTTYGRWPMDGVVPLAASLDTAGILTRSVADAAYAFAAIEVFLPGGTPAPTLTPRPVTSLRLAVTRNYFWNRCSPDIAAIVQAAIDEIAKAGAQFQHNALPEAIEAPQVLAEGAVVAAEGYASLQADFPDWIATLDPFVRQRIEDGRVGLATAYIRARAKIQHLAETANTRLATCDALLVPMVPITPPRLDDLGAWDAYRIANGAVLSNASPVNILGLCAITLPVGLDAYGMPVGLQLIAAGGRDRALIETALGIEAVLGTARMRLGIAPRVRSNA